MTPVVTFSTISTMPSMRYGRYQRTSAKSMKNHAPQSPTLNERIRLMAGLAIRISNGQATPAQYNIAKKIPMKTMPVPRSGCSMMISHGIATTTAGFQRSSSDFGASRWFASTFASISTTVTLAISDGWPMRWLPIASQLFVLAAVPAPLPITNVNPSRNIDSRYSGVVTHSMNRTDEWPTP